MFHKAHLLFTLLCAGSTTAIVIVMSILYLHVSENSLRNNQFRSFQNDIGTITSSLEASSAVSIQWLEKIETQNGYIICVIDNGIPFLYNKLRGYADTYNQSLLSESLDAFNRLFEIAHADSGFTNLTGNAYSRIWHTEYQFYSTSAQESFYSSVIDMEYKNTLSRIVVLCPLTSLAAQITHQRILFLWIDLAAVAVLLAFSWFFTDRLLRPLQENQRLQMQFIAAASHELRTPLSVILASSECCESSSTEEQKGFFSTIRKEGRRMNKLIDDLLTLAHSDTNRFFVERKANQLDTICLNAYEAFESLCRSNRLSLTLTLPEEPLPRCNCDADRIAQVLTILLHNAVSYTPEGGQISLSLSKRGEHTKSAYTASSLRTLDNCGFEITIADTGIGISDEDKKHIFDRFYRAEKSRSTKGHFGLGLSIAHDIVAAHHGKIIVKDNPGGGSVFIVRLPES